MARTLARARVGLDTAPIIYFVEEHPIYLEAVRPFFEAIDRGEFQAITSVVTQLEVLVHPLRQNNIELASKYRDILLNSNGFTCASLSSEVAEEASQLRSQYNVQTPDATQLATAAHEGASFFFTNDAHLPSLPTLRLLIVDELKQQRPDQ
jgi:predicted nucleic acid-binding protein